MKQLTGRVAVVTGAASGIGLAMANHFANEGMKLVLADVDAAALTHAGNGLRASGAAAITVPTDVASEAQVRALADAAFAAYGAVHVVCNNAGVATPALRTLAWETRLSDWEWIHKVNFMGVLYGVREFVPRMLAGGDEGHIVNTASVAGLISGGNPYFVSKHAVACFTEGLYKDLKDYRNTLRSTRAQKCNLHGSKINLFPNSLHGVPHHLPFPLRGIRGLHSVGLL